MFLAAEPSLCSRGSRPRASTGRTRAGYVCGTWREDVSHRSADGGPGTRIHQFHHYELLVNKFLLTQGKVVALDRIRNKIDRILENAQALQLRSIKAFCFNSTQAVSGDAAPQAEGRNIWSFRALLIYGENCGLGVTQNLRILRKVLTGFCWMPPVVDWDKGPTWGPPGA